MTNKIVELLLPFGISPYSSKKLEGYVSTNYKVTDQKGDNYVFKHYTDPTELPIILEEINFVNKIKDLLHFHLPVTIESNGRFIHHYQDGSYARLLRYVNGDFLNEVERNHNLLYDFGKCIAELDIQLGDINAPHIANRKYSWDLQHTLSNRYKIDFIKEKERRKLVVYFFDRFEQFVLPQLPGLRHQIVHNDLNDWNVLCEKDQIVGFIDFGDVAYSPLINELAIAIMYVMTDHELPVAAACSVIQGYCSRLPLTHGEIELLPDLIAARLSVSLCHSAEAKSKSADTDYILISEKGVWNLLKKWITWNPIFLKNAFLKAAELERNSPKPKIKLQEEIRKKHFSKALSLSYNEPIHMDSAAFQYMYDLNGNTYLDAYNNIPLVGHSHPKVSEAVSRQIRHLNTNTRYHTESLYAYTEKLLSYFPNHLNKVFFVNSGTEANDLAQRLSRSYSKHDGTIVLELGYHGHSSEIIDRSAYKYSGKGGKGRKQNICELPLPKLYKGIFSNSAEYIADAKERIEKAISNGMSLGSFLFEPISGCGGQVLLAHGYLKTLVPWLQSQGIVCICDEVQVGFGRLGQWFWGFEMQEVIPDIVVLGKPMANGFPIGAVVTTEAICSAFENGMEFFSSFGGNPISMEAARAILDVIEEEQLQNSAIETGNHFMTLLRELQSRYECIGDVRGEGLFIGVEFRDSNDNPGTELCKYVKNKLKENYILTGSDGRYEETLKMKPPLCFSKANADQVAHKMGHILSEYIQKI